MLGKILIYGTRLVFPIIHLNMFEERVKIVAIYLINYVLFSTRCYLIYRIALN